MAGMIIKIQLIICSLLTLAIIASLILKYRRTRDVGFLWLGVAIVLWPMADGPVRWFLQRHAFGFGNYTVGTVHQILVLCQWVIGLVLQLVAILYLYKKKSALSPS